ncbi:MAG: hypothetical protein QXH35_07180 [Nitrososphaerota archaeon]
MNETYGGSNRIERWFRKLKDRTRRLYDNVNSKPIEEIALTHNPPLTAKREGVIPG